MNKPHIPLEKYLENRLDGRDVLDNQPKPMSH